MTPLPGMPAAARRASAAPAGLALACLVAGALSRLWPQAWHAWQMGFGIVAALLLLATSAYAVRRRLPGRPLGRTAIWLHWHRVGGALFMLMVLIHSGFHAYGGALNLALWFTSIWMTLTGLLGLWIQWWIPRVLTSGLSDEVHFDRIPELVTALKAGAEKLVASCSDPIQGFYRTRLAPMFMAPQPSFDYYMDVSGGPRRRTKEFELLARSVGAEERVKLERLESMLHAKLELDAHRSLQQGLRGWLMLHVPATIILLLLVIVHVVLVLVY